MDVLEGRVDICLVLPIPESHVLTRKKAKKKKKKVPCSAMTTLCLPEKSTIICVSVNKLISWMYLPEKSTIICASVNKLISWMYLSIIFYCKIMIITIPVALYTRSLN